MKAQAGWGAAALVAAAAVVGVTSQPGAKPVSNGVSTASPARVVHSSTEAEKGAFDRGPCVDLEAQFQTFLGSGPEQRAAPASCYDETSLEKRESAATLDQKSAVDLEDGASSMQFVIAILPDPVHTHFSLTFDRLTEAIQQGAQDEGYTYDSSWLPWKTDEPPVTLLADQEKADDEKTAREEQPGILLFRRSRHDKVADPHDTDEPYWDGLAVLVVGEEPTSGIHKEQFKNSIDWIVALKAGKGDPQQKPLKILGPTFSGSLESLAQGLKEVEENRQALGLSASDPTLSIYSGGVTSKSLANQFAQSVGYLDVTFRSFQENEDILLRRYLQYLSSEGIERSKVAVISEDETAFGARPVTDFLNRPAPASDDDLDLCPPQRPPNRQGGAWQEGPTCFYYPRDISALRNAYQKESIFNSSSTEQSSSLAKRTLTTDLADQEGDIDDTIQGYGGSQSAISQESVLLQIVTMMRAHHSQYVLLRSSNPLDQLFLSQFFRLTYPQVRVVIVGSDLLLRREGGATQLSGVMTLTTYPLLSQESHWTIDGLPHSHRIFEQDIAEGTYVASRFLLHPGKCAGEERIFVPPNNCDKLNIPDYAPPFWNNLGAERRRPPHDLAVGVGAGRLLAGCRDR